MRYWQITTRRLSKAAAKLEMDEEWHPFTSTPNAWYRVWRKKLVQRVNFSSDEEERTYLDAIKAIEPLPEMATVSGFREEMNMIAMDDTLYLALPVGYAPANLPEIERALKPHGIRTSIMEGLLYGLLPIPQLDRPSLLSAQTQLVSLRLFFQAALTSPDAATLASALAAFQRALPQS